MPVDAAPWDTPANATAYARFCRTFPYRRDAALQLARFAAVREATWLADLGCGTGVSTRALAKAAPRARVVGIDPAPAMLAEARRVARSNRVTYATGDSASLPALAGPMGFDAVICVSALWLADDLAATLGHVVTSLRAGGRFVFSFPAELVGEVEHLLEPAATRFYATLAACRRREGLPDPAPVPPKAPLSLAGWADLLAAAGFSDLRTEVYGTRMTVTETLAHLAIPAVAAAYLPGASRTQVQRVLSRVRDELAAGSHGSEGLDRVWRHVAVTR